MNSTKTSGNFDQLLIMNNISTCNKGNISYFHMFEKVILPHFIITESFQLDSTS